MKTLGWNRIVCVFKMAFGRVEDLPFDLRQRRVRSYKVQAGEDRGDQRKLLAGLLKADLRAIFDAMLDKRDDSENASDRHTEANCLAFIELPQADRNVPASAPLLAIDVTVSHHGDGKTTFSLINVGNATARELHIVQNRGRIAWASIRAPIRDGRHRIPSGYSCETPLHPGQSVALGSVQLKHQGQIHGDFFQWNPIALQFTVHASDQSPQIISVVLGEDDLNGRRPKRFSATSTPT